MSRILSKFVMAFLILSVIGVSACEKKNKLKMDNENLIEKDPTFDRSKFIEQSKERSSQEYKFGPQIEIDRPFEERENSRTFINREENFDFVDISEMEKNNFKVSINVENMDIRTFSEMISSMTGVNILVSDEVSGNVTAKLTDVYWTNMLDSILNTKKLAKYIDNKSNIIRLHDQGTVVQLEDFEQKRKENVQRSMMLKKASQPLNTEIFKLFYTKPDQIKKQIEEILVSKDSASGAGIRNINPEVSIDTRKNLLIIKARKEDMDIIAKMIKELDTRTKQVFIEAFIVEVKDGFDQAFGTRVGLHVNNNNTTVAGTGATVTPVTTLGDSTNTISNLPVTDPFGGIGILSGIGSSTQLKVELNALQTMGLSKIISNPRIFTLDNQQAVIFQGVEVPYETVSQEGTQIQFKEAGLKLSVTPTVIGDGNLQMDITVNKDSADTSISNPPITKSEIKTNLVTKDGEIVVMGGIYTETNSETKDKTPGLGDIPAIGHLFRRDVDEKKKTELIIFISPKVL